MNQQTPPLHHPHPVAPEPDAPTSEEVLVVLATAPEADAFELARTLVEEELVACVNLVPKVQSVYRWQGEVRDDREVLLLMKTHRSAFEHLERRYLELHSYDVPELLALSVTAGHAAYLHWVGSINPAPSGG